MNKLVIFFAVSVILISAYLLIDANQKADPKAQYELYCGGCHMLPDIQNIPKSMWENAVLPEMGARMGIRYNDYDPFQQETMEENYYIKLTNVYPGNPILDSLEWQKIHDYVLSQAPDTVLNLPDRSARNTELTQFNAALNSLDQNNGPSGITNVQFDSSGERLFIGNYYGQLYEWGSSSPFERRFNSPIISSYFDEKEDAFYLTEIGEMNPSEIPQGALYELNTDGIELFYKGLHRPVFTLSNDLNDDGELEFVICEFGFHTGKLSLLEKKDSKFEKRTLIPLPGSIKIEVADLNFDGKKDLVVLFSQGKEGMYILYQRDNMQFETDYVIQMQPEYGSSWFELIDYDKDGHLDIIMANGDNADYSNFLKPYHGVRLFLNDGENQFEEKWFYPINGATRVIAEDFDTDGDIDIAVLSFFPDFDNDAENGFTYLENMNSSGYEFKSYAVDVAKNGNWLVMDKGDVDKDGDIDIVLGNFPMLTTDKEIQRNRSDLLILKNKLIMNK